MKQSKLETVVDLDAFEDSLKVYIWNVMGISLLYAADLIPEIADDIVNIDNVGNGVCIRKGPRNIRSIE